MDPRQRVYFQLFQVIVFGIVILVGGLIAKHTAFVIVGALVTVFGAIRAVVIGKHIKNINDEDIE